MDRLRRALCLLPGNGAAGKARRHVCQPVILPDYTAVNKKCKHWDRAEMQVAPAAQAFHRPTRCNSTAIASSRSGMLTIVERNQNPAAMRADMAPIRLRTRRARVGSKVLIFDLRNERRSAKLYPLRLRLS